MAQFCQICGATVVDEKSDFCSKCGSKLIKEQHIEKPRTCPYCGTTLQVPDAPFCHKCGNKLASLPSVNLNKTGFTRQDIFERAIPFFTTKGYQPLTQTDYVLTFQSEKREVSWLVLVILLCCGILLGVIYYYVFCPKHLVTLSLSGNTDVKVTAVGNTDEAKRDAASFMSTIKF